jgi:GNAT superfamily N-acetyltransferase
MAHRLRLATLDDVPALNALIAASARGLSAPLYSAEQIESAIRYIYGADTQLIQDGTYFVAEAENQLAGCGGWSRRRTLYGGDQMKSGADAQLDRAHEPARGRAFFVHPQSARRGIARDILQACMQAASAAGFRSMELASTLPGVALYERYGFEAVEHCSPVLPNGVVLPLVRMRRVIMLSGGVP